MKIYEKYLKEATPLAKMSKEELEAKREKMRKIDNTNARMVIQSINLELKRRAKT